MFISWLKLKRGAYIMFVLLKTVERGLTLCLNIMFKDVAGVILCLYHVQSCRGRHIHYVFIKFKDVEEAYIMFIPCSKL